MESLFFLPSPQRSMLALKSLILNKMFLVLKVPLLGLKLCSLPSNSWCSKSFSHFESGRKAEEQTSLCLLLCEACKGSLNIHGETHNLGSLKLWQQLGSSLEEKAGQSQWLAVWIPVLQGPHLACGPHVWHSCSLANVGEFTRYPVVLLDVSRRLFGIYEQTGLFGNKPNRMCVHSKIGLNK